MNFVKTVIYSILINGADYRSIQLSRGLRQGDPISPYLFLLCAEVLSQLFQKAERENRLKGIKIARSCPSVSHFFC